MEPSLLLERRLSRRETSPVVAAWCNTDGARSGIRKDAAAAAADDDGEDDGDDDEDDAADDDDDDDDD